MKVKHINYLVREYAYNQNCKFRTHAKIYKNITYVYMEKFILNPIMQSLFSHEVIWYATENSHRRMHWWGGNLVFIYSGGNFRIPMILHRANEATLISPCYGLYQIGLYLGLARTNTLMLFCWSNFICLPLERTFMTANANSRSD